MCLKCDPRASRARPEPRNGPSRVPKGGPRESQNDPKITFLKALGHRCATKGPQGLSRYPPNPESSQNGAKIGLTMTQKTQKNKGQRLNKQMIKVLWFFGWLPLLAAAEWAKPT